MGGGRGMIIQEIKSLGLLLEYQRHAIAGRLAINIYAIYHHSNR